MKTLAVVVGSVLLGSFALSAGDESPFTVTPKVEFKDGRQTLRVAFDIPPNHVLYADKLVFKLAGEEMPVPFNLPEPALIQDRFSGKEKRVFNHSFEASCVRTALPTGNLDLSVHFQGCDEANCFFPEDRTYSVSPAGRIARLDESAEESPSETPGEWQAVAAGFTVANRGSGYLGEKEFLGFLDKSQSGGPAGEPETARGGFWGVLMTMALIVLGGVALNLTPCILPMIPINLAIIGAGARAGSRKRGFALGATYAAGMAIAYGALGLVVVLTGAKFGTLNSSPWFNLGIAAVFFVLALAMFDLFSIDLSRFQSGAAGGSLAARSKFVLAYSMGTVAALLAGACVAPVVISVLLQATALHAKGVAVGLLLPFLLGLGMGLPWPFAGAGLSFLPKPGKWMMRVKYGFGVLIIAFAAYYGRLSLVQFSADAATVAHAQEHPGASGPDQALIRELAQALTAAKADGRPVFLDFWASWCKNCSAMEHTTFAAAAVKQRLADFHEVRFQAERPNQFPAKAVLDHFKVLGLPSYVVLLPNRSEPTASNKVGATASLAP